jgi:hypothetical protein
MIVQSCLVSAVVMKEVQLRLVVACGLTSQLISIPDLRSTSPNLFQLFHHFDLKSSKTVVMIFHFLSP